MTLRKTILFLMFFIVCFYVYCEEDKNETSEKKQEEDVISVEILKDDKYSEETIFIINSFNYNVIGRTLPFVLNNKTELKKGEEITGKTNLIKFIKDKRQLLTNERVLKDNVKIEYAIGEAAEDGKYPVDLQIYVEDTWNIIALPYPKYSSNYGFELTIKARDYNFFGTMHALRVDLGYKYDQDGQSFFSLMVDSGVPFQVFGLDFLFDFDNYFDYRPDMDLPYYYKNKTAISLDIPIKRSTLNLLFSESFILNEENDDSDKPYYGDFQEGLYLSSKPSITWKIPTGLEIGEYGELTYTPNVNAVFNHELPLWPLLENRIGPIAFFNHTLYFGRLNWIDNFRKGVNVQINNSYSYNFYYPKIDIEPWKYDYGIDIKTFFIFIKDIFGFSARLSHRHWINSNYEYAGDLLRGVYDKDVNAEFILTLNLDIHIRALKIDAYKWFPNNKFLRSLGFDLHINPVIDGAFYKKPSKDASFDPENFLLGAGFDTIIYPHQFRSVFFRISTCWDFSDISKRTPIELFLGME
ncbi:hypothetical protein, partial [Treponema sp. R80B11-R83G3]